MRKTMNITDKSRWFVILGILLLSLFMMAGCGSSDENTSDNEKNKDTAEWYQSVLEDESAVKDYPYYALVDIDQDGTDELFLSSTEKAFVGAEDKAKMMAYVDKKAVDVKKIGGAGGESFSYDQSDKSLFYYYRLSGEEHIIKYTYAKGKLTEVQTADKYALNHDPNGNKPDNDDDMTYYLDGKKVSEDKADVLWDQFDDDSKAITYSKDGKGSTAEDADDADGDDDDDADGDD